MKAHPEPSDSTTEHLSCFSEWSDGGTLTELQPVRACPRKALPVDAQEVKYKTPYEKSTWQAGRPPKVEGELCVRATNYLDNVINDNSNLDIADYLFCSGHVLNL